MAQFGWAYVNCGDVTGSGGGGQAAGPTGSLQFLTGANATSGSAKLVFYTSSYGSYSANTMLLSGTLVVQGTITASSFIVDQTDVISGSTIFGNSDDDYHIRTGSLYVGASASAPTFQVTPSTSQAITLGLRVNYRSVTSAGTSSTSDYILGFGGAGAIEYRVHSASDAGAGSLLLIKDELSSRGGAITLSASGGETIDGNTSYEITGSSPAISLYSNGSNWFVF
jgi:hypothetical protein